MTAADLCTEIEARRDAALRTNAGPWPRTQPVPSDLSECTRAMVLSVLHWQDRPAFDPYVVARLDRGNLIEDAIKRELRGLGYIIREERRPFEIKDRKGRVVLRGRLDGFIEQGKEAIPFEAKSVNPNVFHHLRSLEDFGRFWYTRRWPQQLQAYLYGENLPEGILVLDDCLGHWRLIPVSIDFEALEPIIERCEAAVECLETLPELGHGRAVSLPPFHPDPTVCKRCWAWNRVCFPPLAGQGLTTIEDAELEADLNRRGALRDSAKEYEALDRTIKERVRGKDGLVVGPWLIRGKEVVVHRKAQEARDRPTWRTDIVRVDTGQETEAP